MTLEQLQKQEQELEQLLSENRAKQREIHTKAFVEKYGVDVGDLVEWVDAFGTIRRGVIIGPEYAGVDFLTVVTNLLNNNGEVSGSQLRIWKNEFHTIKVIKKNIKQS